MKWGSSAMCVGRERTRGEKDKSKCRRLEMIDGAKSRRWCDKLGWGRGAGEQGVLFSELGEGTTDNTDVFRALWLKDPMFSVLQGARPSGAARRPGEV